MEQKELVKLAVERINHILDNESDKIQACYATDNDEIVVELSNGMNLNLSQSEVEYRAEQQIHERKVEMERDEVVHIIADHYVKTMGDEIREGESSLLFALLMGEGMKPISEMSDESLCIEFKELFNKDIIMMK